MCCLTVHALKCSPLDCRLIRRGTAILAVRRWFQCVSFLGCAASALPLALGSPSLALAVGCLTANLAFYSVRCVSSGGLVACI